MRALKKNKENLKYVAERICSIDFYCGQFTIDSLDNDGVVLFCPSRIHFGKSIASYIPSNWIWSVSFEDSILKLYIWL